MTPAEKKMYMTSQMFMALAVTPLRLDEIHPALPRNTKRADKDRGDHLLLVPLGRPPVVLSAVAAAMSQSTTRLFQGVSAETKPRRVAGGEGRDLAGIDEAGKDMRADKAVKSLAAERNKAGSLTGAV